MLNTATITIKTDPKTKSEAQALAEKFGLSLSSALNALMKQFVRTQKLDLDASTDDLKLSDWAKEQLALSETDRKAGHVYSFDNAKQAASFLRDRSNKLESDQYED